MEEIDDDDDLPPEIAASLNGSAEAKRIRAQARQAEKDATRRTKSAEKVEPGGWKDREAHLRWGEVIQRSLDAGQSGASDYDISVTRIWPLTPGSGGAGIGAGGTSCGSIYGTSVEGGGHNGISPQEALYSEIVNVIHASFPGPAVYEVKFFSRSRGGVEVTHTKLSLDAPSVISGRQRAASQAQQQGFAGSAGHNGPIYTPASAGVPMLPAPQPQVLPPAPPVMTPGMDPMAMMAAYAQHSQQMMDWAMAHAQRQVGAAATPVAQPVAAVVSVEDSDAAFMERMIKLGVIKRPGTLDAADVAAIVVETLRKEKAAAAATAAVGAAATPATAPVVTGPTTMAGHVRALASAFQDFKSAKNIFKEVFDDEGGENFAEVVAAAEARGPTKDFEYVPTGLKAFGGKEIMRKQYVEKVDTATGQVIERPPETLFEKATNYVEANQHILIEDFGQKLGEKVIGATGTGLNKLAEAASRLVDAGARKMGGAEAPPVGPTGGSSSGLGRR